jgi:hypothetical protein
MPSATDLHRSTSNPAAINAVVSALVSVFTSALVRQAIILIILAI